MQADVENGIDRIQLVLNLCGMNDTYKGIPYMYVTNQHHNEIDSPTKLAFFFGLSTKKYLLFRNSSALYMVNQRLIVYSVKENNTSTMGGYINALLMKEQLKKGQTLDEYFEEKKG